MKCSAYNSYYKNSQFILHGGNLNLYESQFFLLPQNLHCNWRWFKYIPFNYLNIYGIAESDLNEYRELFIEEIYI